MKTYTVTVDDYGTKRWYLNDKPHREDGPAMEWADGTKCWYLNGERHRTDGPAIEEADGAKRWFMNGKCHRTDGPAIEYSDGTKHWYFHGVKLTETQWLWCVQEVKASCAGKMVEIDGVKYKLVEA
jgi:hypothetical protein